MLGDQVQLLGEDLRRLRQDAGRFLQLRQHRQALPVRCPPGRADQPVRHQHREQVERVVDRLRLQLTDHRRQQRGPPRLRGPLDRLRFAQLPVPGQRGQPVHRHP
ncbi:hypothetical protein NKH77_56040 [Streptomyces sp. M19]